MCHNSGVQSAQIEKFVEHGMPQKIVKTVKYTLKKRARENALLDSDSISEEEATSAEPCNCNSTISTINTIAKSTTTKTTQEIPTELSKLVENINELKIPKMCGRFRKLQQDSSIANINGSDGDGGGGGTLTLLRNQKVYVDALSVVTQLTKQVAQHLSQVVQKLQNSKIYTWLTKTTQPAHIIAICILSFVLLTVCPDLIFGDADTKSNGGRSHHTLATIAYLGAFATHFGAQIWMTFVSGLSLYFSLPRHTFGQCQQILFPKYFALNSLLSICMLILFVKYFLSTWNVAGCVQLGALALTAFIEVTVRLYLAPPMLMLMHEKYKIEGAIGSGREVGTIVQGDLVQCPHYQRIHKAFRRIHMTIAMGNMVVLLATCLHLYFLASKIQIS